MIKYFLPGWRLVIDKTSHNSKLIYVHDKRGKIIIEGEISEVNIEKAILLIFEKEREEIKSWSKFLYDMLVSTIDSDLILFHNYSEQEYSSWIIRGNGNLEIEYNGRDKILNLIERKPSLRAIVSIPDEKITYQNLIETCKRL